MQDLLRQFRKCGAGMAKYSAWIYRISLTTWGMLAGEPAPTGAA
ncbi:hypothetical protein [Streptomyces sp. NPDC059256]